MWTSDKPFPHFFTFWRQSSNGALCIGGVGFNCWHDYGTNPREVALLVSENGKTFEQWDVFVLEQRSGQFLFPIRPVPMAKSFFRLSVQSNYGEDQTYLNNVYFYAEAAKDQHLVSPVERFASERKGQRILPDRPNGLSENMSLPVMSRPAPASTKAEPASALELEFKSPDKARGGSRAQVEIIHTDKTLVQNLEELGDRRLLFSPSNCVDLVDWRNNEMLMTPNPKSAVVGLRHLSRMNEAVLDELNERVSALELQNKALQAEVAHLRAQQAEMSQRKELEDSLSDKISRMEKMIEQVLSFRKGKTPPAESEPSLDPEPRIIQRKAQSRPLNRTLGGDLKDFREGDNLNKVIKYLKKKMDNNKKTALRVLGP